MQWPLVFSVCVLSLCCTPYRGHTTGKPLARFSNLHTSYGITVNCQQIHQITLSFNSIPNLSLNASRKGPAISTFVYGATIPFSWIRTSSTASTPTAHGCPVRLSRRPFDALTGHTACPGVCPVFPPFSQRYSGRISRSSEGRKVRAVHFLFVRDKRGHFLRHCVLHGCDWCGCWKTQ